jgi:FMN-dependent NADH-azoreductase
MSRLLFVNASARREASESLRIAETLLSAYREIDPASEVDRIDLFDQPLAVFGSDGATAKMAVLARRDFTPGQAEAWDHVKATFARLEAADTLLFTAPMWNAGIPWPLKHLIDTVTQPGMVFRFDPATGYHGLLGGRRATVVYTSSVYRPGIAPAFGNDFHSTYMENWLRFAGIDEIHSVRLQPTFPSPDLDERREQALEEARTLGQALAERGVAVAR